MTLRSIENPATEGLAWCRIVSVVALLFMLAGCAAADRSAASGSPAGATAPGTAAIYLRGNTGYSVGIGTGR
jgi:hypothetical protein